jgi:type II secretory pathway pseudopilin PulG
MMTKLREANGFSMIELLVATVITTAVVGGAVAMTVQVQNGYRRQSEDAVGEQEARYALEFIGRYIRGAGFNPFNVITSTCPTGAGNTPFVGVVIDPNIDGVMNDVTLQMDANPPDGLIGGVSGACNQANEHVTISLDAVNDTIVFQDEAVGAAATTRTDSVIENLRFVFKEDDREIMDGSAGHPYTPANVVYIETQITIRSRTINAQTGLPNTRMLASEVRVRGR